MEGKIFLTGLIQSRGYIRSNDFIFIREKPLIDTPFEPVNLPPGYLVRILDPLEWDGYFEAIDAVFHMMDTPEAFASIQRAPSNVHELHLNVATGQNQIAAFCSVWLDRENHVAVPQFQKQGLGTALMAHACNRLREMNCPTAKVES